MNTKRRCLFLDRDGVINLDRGYISKFFEIEFSENIFNVCRRANELGWLIIVVTNQGGIGRGFVSEDEFQELSTLMIENFETNGAYIDKIYHCPFHPNASIPEFKGEHPWRKPNPGMFLAAKNEFCIEMASSIVIGDSLRDLIAGHRAGVAQKFLYVGKGAKPYVPSSTGTIQQDLVDFSYKEIDNLLEVGQYL